MRCLEVAGLYLFLQLTVLLVKVYGRCPAIDGVLPTVPNGYRSNVDNLRLYSDGTAEGYYDILCNPGFALNPDIGGRITCLSSDSWSQPFPQCNSMGQCSISTLFTYLQSADGLVITQSQSFIYTNGVDSDQALGGSNITIQCADGYINVGGSLTIVCTQANSWTTYPICFSTTTATTTVAPLPRCPLAADTWNFANGYLSNTQNIVVYSDNTAQGSIVVSCVSGYAIDSVSNGVYNCVGGSWSPRPYCTKTARCSLSAVQAFLSDYTATPGLQIISQGVSINAAETDQVLVGSFLLFGCTNNYMNTDNNLNVVCNADGQWSPFPSCIALSTTAVPGTTILQLNLDNNGAAMPMDGGNKRKKRWIQKHK